MTLSFSHAQEKARKFADKIIRGEDHDTKPYTVQSAINDYMADFKASGKKSYYPTETQINAHIKPEFSNHLVSALTFKKLNTWKNKLATTNKRARTAIGKDQQFLKNQNEIQNTNANDEPQPIALSPSSKQF